MLAPRELFNAGRIFRIVLMTYGPMAQLIYCAPVSSNVGPTGR